MPPGFSARFQPVFIALEVLRPAAAHRQGVRLGGLTAFGPALGVMIVLLWLGSQGAARAEQFGFRPGGPEEAAPGIVTSQGIDLFEIRSTAGGLHPIRRAEMIAARLSTLEQDHPILPDSLTLGHRGGEMVISQGDGAQPASQVLVTIDQALADQVTGSGGSMERLAAWWLALLQDHLYLGMGQPPVATAGTPVGDAFQKVYQSLGPPTGPVSDAEIRQAIENLPADLRQDLVDSSHRVPAAFHPHATGVSATPAELPTAGTAASPATTPVPGDEAAPAGTAPADTTTSNATTNNANTNNANTNNANTNNANTNNANTGDATGAAAPRDSAAPPDTAPAAPDAGDAGAAPSTGTESADNAAATGTGANPAGDSFKIQLVTKPSPLVAGQNSLVTVKIAKLTAGSAGGDAGDSTPVHGAAVVVRIRAQAAAPDSRWAIAHPLESAPGSYSFHAVFHSNGAYSISVTVVPTIDEPFTAMLAAQVGPKADKNPAAPAGGGAPGAGAPPDNGTPAGGGAPASGAPANGTPANGTPASGAPASGAPASGAPADSGAPAGGVVPPGGTIPTSGDSGALSPAGNITPDNAGVNTTENGVAGAVGSGLPSVPGEPAPFSCLRRDPTTVRNLGVPLITEVVTYDRMSPAVRAAKLAARLNDCYVNDLKAPRTVMNMRQGNLIGDPNKTEYVFFGYLHANGRDTADIIATVDPATAAHYRVSPLTLACWWRDILRDWLLIDQGQPPRFTVPYTTLLMDFYKNLQAGQGDMHSRFLTAMSNLIDSNDEYEKIARLSGQVPADYRVHADNYHPILNDDSNPKTSG